MGTLLDLANRLDKIAADIPKKINDGKKAVVFSIVNDLVWKTPVDTSNALSNWQVSIGQPINVEIDPYVPGYLGYTAAASANAALLVAKQVLNKVKPGERVYIVNNAPYISNLNNGSSKQEPAGFVERAILLGRLEITSIKVLNK